MIATLTAPEASTYTTRRLLTAVHERCPALVVDSPPGAGKTTIGTKMAATAAGLLKESMMVACWTNRQAIDFAIRVASDFSAVPVQLFMREDLRMMLPEVAFSLKNLTLVHKTADLRPGGVAVSNSSKWTVRPLDHTYDWLLVDEAYQIAEFKFRSLAPMASRYVLIGDPGQIAPLIQADVSPWGCDWDGPHVPAPTALLARHPDVEIEHLPVSWRLPRTSAALVREAFYDFDFVSGDQDGKRRLVIQPASGTRTDPLLDRFSEPGTSITSGLLDADLVATDVDPELAAYLAEGVHRMFERNPSVWDDEAASLRELRLQDVGVVTAHRAQVAEIDKRLRSRGIKTGEGGVVVETTERWQGLEREVMFVHHPLAGLESLSSFELDRGRLCVMLSRHKTACIVVGRQGMDIALQNHPHDGQRFPGATDEEFLGWRAHKHVASALLPNPC